MVFGWVPSVVAGRTETLNAAWACSEQFGESWSMPRWRRCWVRLSLPSCYQSLWRVTTLLDDTEYWVVRAEYVSQCPKVSCTLHKPWWYYTCILRYILSNYKAKPFCGYFIQGRVKGFVTHVFLFYRFINNTFQAHNQLHFFCFPSTKNHTVRIFHTCTKTHARHFGYVETYECPSLIYDCKSIPAQYLGLIFSEKL